MSRQLTTTALTLLSRQSSLSVPSVARTTTMQRLLSNAAQQPVVRRVGSREGGREGREGEEEGYVHMN
jgi:hypothetical protein